MCFYLASTKTALQLANRYKAQLTLFDDFVPQEKVNGFALPKLPVVTLGDQIEIRGMQWGLIPHWYKEPDTTQIQRMTLNARSETVFSKPAFKAAILKKRCLLPVTSFYEWRHEGNKKIPYKILLPENDIFSLGAIYDEWRNPMTGETLQSFSIITTPANPLMEYVHNSKLRMPLIIDPANENAWISPQASQETISTLMNPYDERFMSAQIIS